jgi:hypothetical protein
MKSSSEIYGRGQGTEILPDVMVLQAMQRDLVECAQKWNNPPREVSDSFVGDVKTFPGARNNVQEVGKTIKALDQAVNGSFPITREIVELQQEKIHKAFFRDIFVQLGDLTGDRRTTVEIMERIREGLKRLSTPVARIQDELFNPTLTRCLMLLIKNGVVPPPPPELQGEGFGINYTGPLAMALRDQQANGFISWVGNILQVAEVFPEALDIPNIDSGVRRLGTSLGVSADDMATPEMVQAKRDARAQQIKQQQELEAVDVAAKAYGKGKDAAQPGSPAAELMASMK